MKTLFCAVAFLLSVATSGWAQALTINNFSFETDAVTPFPTYRTSITDWVMTGGTGFGVNTNLGPFFDNGVNPDGAKVLFLQNVVAANQDIAGFVLGQAYAVRMGVNARTATAPATLRVSVGGNIIVPPMTISPVGGTNAFIQINQVFNSTAAGTQTLTIENVNGSGDNSLLVDKVEIVESVNAAGDWSLYE